MVTPTEISQKLDDLQDELEDVKNKSEEEVCEQYGADSKADIVEAIEEEIESLQTYMGDDYSDDDMDYAELQRSQGLPVIFW